MRLSGSDRLKIAAAVKADIDAFCVSEFTEGPRKHIGASEMGKDCTRALVYGFRWMFKPTHSGQLLRLFNRGHMEEDRFARWLSGIGAKLATVDARTGKQFRIGGDHYGGSLDGILELPERYQLPFDILCEMKTHNDKSFKRLVKDGVQKSKPQHFDQMCQYGTVRNLDYALYIAVNKNDDNIYVELVAIDRSRGQFLIRRGESVVAAKELPPRVAASPAYETCKFCDYAGICHLNWPVAKNCRSCKFAIAVPDGKWHCNRWQRDIPPDFIPQGCADWQEFGK